MIPEKFHQQIIELLNKEYKLYKDLENILNEEKKALTEFNYDKLNDLNFKKEGVLLNIIEFKNKRNEIISKISREFNLDEDALTLKFLYEISKGEVKNFYKNIREKFKIIGEKIKNLNEINKFAIETSLKFIEKSLQMLNQNISPSTYSNYGKISSRFSTSIYTNKI